LDDFLLRCLAPEASAELEEREVTNSVRAVEACVEDESDR
jgi:hypothetical protein